MPPLTSRRSISRVRAANWFDRALRSTRLASAGLFLGDRTAVESARSPVRHDPQLSSRAAESTRRTRTGGEIRHYFERCLDHGDDHELRQPLQGLQRERSIAAIPAAIAPMILRERDTLTVLVNSQTSKCISARRPGEFGTKSTKFLFGRKVNWYQALPPVK